jgi:hypothetical protein
MRWERLVLIAIVLGFAVFAIAPRFFIGIDSSHPVKEEIKEITVDIKYVDGEIFHVVTTDGEIFYVAPGVWGELDRSQKYNVRVNWGVVQAAGGHGTITEVIKGG